MKVNLYLALKNRVIKTSHHNFSFKELCRLRKIVLRNSYPLKFINKLHFATVRADIPSHVGGVDVVVPWASPHIVVSLVLLFSSVKSPTP